MKRSINGFDIDWLDKHLIEVRRDHDPKHAYEFETSPDQSRLRRKIAESWHRQSRRRSTTTVSIQRVGQWRQGALPTRYPIGQIFELLRAGPAETDRPPPPRVALKDRD